jgi:cellulase/cellobiase CelA1
MTSTADGFTTIWIDGVNSGSANQSSFTNNIFYYVGYAGSGSEYWRGYIDEARISAVCRYTANFTPPTEAFPDA